MEPAHKQTESVSSFDASLRHFGLPVEALPDKTIKPGRLTLGRSCHDLFEPMCFGTVSLLKTMLRPRLPFLVEMSGLLWQQ